jgi:hypothetical protein
MPTTTSPGLASSTGHAMVMRSVTVIMATVIGLTFLFGFGNVLALGLRLGVPAYVAPLVAPAVDLSVLGLLLGVRYLALNDAPREQMRPARRLLIMASVMTLALNVTEPLAREYGKAAFDAVGPLLLIGWAEVGPGLLRAISATGRAAEAKTESDVDVRVNAPAPRAKQPRTVADGVGRARREKTDRIDPELLQRARLEDARHREAAKRPISAETLRKRLGIGAKKSRALVAAIRSEREQQDSTNYPDVDSGEVFILNGEPR